MKFQIIKIVDFILVVVIAGAVIYFFRDPLGQVYLRLEKQFFPCQASNLFFGEV